MPFIVRFGIFYLLFQSMVAAIFYLAWKTGYLIDTPAQAALREPEFRNDANIGFLVKHGGIIGDLLWVSAIGAFCVALKGEQWNTEIFIAVFVVVAMACVPVLEQWRLEGIKVPSALGRGGYFTIESGVHYLYMVLIATAALMFVGTPGLAHRDIWVVAGLLAGHVALGILQPIYSSTGSIPPHTWAIFAGGEGLVVGLAAVRSGIVWHWGV